MSYIGAIKQGVKTILDGNMAINGWKAGERMSALGTGWTNVGGLKGLLTADYANWSPAKRAMLGEHGGVSNMSAEKIAKSMFMADDGTMSLKALGGAYVGGSLMVNGNMGIPFISSD